MPYLVTVDGPIDGQFDYTLTPGEEFTPACVTAQWDGSGLASPALAALSIYSPAGELIGRVFPSTQLEVGDTAEVTYAPFLRQDEAAASATAAIYPGSPCMVDLFSDAGGNHDTSNWATVTVDARVRHNAYLQNTGLNGSYVTRHVTLGPKGSIWGLIVSYAVAPDAGKLDYQLASIASPNPNRAGVDDEGTLTDNALTYLTLAAGDDTYAAAFADGGHNGLYPFRITGDDGDPFTAFLGSNDPYTGFAQIDGGAGVYAVKVKVNGNNGASTGFHARLTELGFVRLDDSGFF